VALLSLQIRQLVGRPPLQVAHEESQFLQLAEVRLGKYPALHVQLEGEPEDAFESLQVRQPAAVVSWHVAQVGSQAVQC
jgi:hypothetical protein